MEEWESDLKTLPDDCRILKVYISDLLRRQKNSLHTIESQQRALAETQSQNEEYKKQLIEMNKLWTLEKMRSGALERKARKVAESRMFETEAARAAAFHQELRLTVIDRKAAGLAASKLESKYIRSIKSSLAEVERLQRSRRELLERYAWIDSSAEAMCTAAGSGDLLACTELVNKGASVNETDAAGMLPILYACREGHTAVVRFLLESGSDYSSYLTGLSPIEKAAIGDHAEVIALLVEFGASVEDGGKGGRPPLVSAAAHGAINSIDLLLDLGVDPDVSDLADNTALHVVMTSLQDPAAIIHTLLSRGADKHKKNLSGETPVTLSLKSLNMSAIEAIGARPHKFS